jgi:hypothetical protein
MLQELKHLYTQDSKTSFMKYILTSLLMAVLLIGSSLNEIKAQNLQFNSAVFYEYGPSNGNTNSFWDVIFTGQLIVNEGKTLKITSGLCNSLSPYGNGVILLNDKILWQTGAEIWLPSGIYEIKLLDSPTNSGTYKGFISGVLYDIVP